MSKKIRLGYDILSKRAIETESGINIDEALKGKVSVQKVAGTGADSHPDVERPNTQVIYLVKSASSGSSETFKQWMWTQPANAEGYWECVSDNTDLSEIEAAIENFQSNIDYVYIDPENGDDTKDGLTRNTAVKNLERASEVYVSKFGRRIVKACLINTHTCERGTQPNPSNTSNLFLPDLEDIDSVYLFGDNGICISNCDYQNEPGPEYSAKSIPTYELHLKFEYGVGVWLYRMATSGAYGDAYSNVIDVESISGDVNLSGGSYGKTLKKARVIAKNGRIWWGLSPEFNTYSNVTTEYEFESLGFTEYSAICGKQIKITTLYDGMYNSEVNSIYSGLWCKGNIYIKAIGTLCIYGPIFCSGRVNISSVESAIRTYDNPTVTFYSAIMGRGNDDESYYSSDPSRSTYPEINIDWAGTVLFCGAHCNNLNIKAWKFALYSSSPILSQRDLIINAEYIDLYNYSTSANFYCLGKMIFRSPNEIKIAQYLYTDELIIDAGGRPNSYPINYSSYQYPYFSTAGVTGTSNIVCKVTNPFESILGDATPEISTSEAHYFIKCSGDYADQWSTIINGNAVVSLEVGGHAYLSGNGAMIVKRLVLESKSAFITNGGIYASSFDIKTGQLFWNNSGYLNQWVSYGTSLYIGNRSISVSWTNDFEDRSILSCESLAQLTTSTSGFIHPGYGQKRHDWDINIKVLIPYIGYGYGTEYCAVLGYVYTGSPTGSIGGEIGDVLFTDCKISNFPHDWILPSSFESSYNTGRVGNVVSLHFTHKKWHHVYIDFDQGADAYDGMSKETPVKSMRGLNRAINQFQYPAYLTIHVCGASGNNRGNQSSQWGPYNSLDFYSSFETVNGGMLYNFQAVEYINSHISELGIPTGWHVPSKSEYWTLANQPGGNDAKPFRARVIGGFDRYGFNEVCADGYNIGNYDTGADWNNPVSQCQWTSDREDSRRADVVTVGYSNSWSTTSFDTLLPIRLVKSNDESLPTGTTGTVDIGGSTYDTIVIGSQIWITKNLDFKFSGGTYRDGTSGNIFTYNTTDPQYGYPEYHSNGNFGISIANNPNFSLYWVAIVADDPYLSLTVRGPLSKYSCTALKMYGFHTLNVIDCYSTIINLQADLDLRYCCGYSTTKNESPSVIYLRGGNVYTYGMQGQYNTTILADEKYSCRSGDSNFGTGRSPKFEGSTYIHAKLIEFEGSPCTFRGCATVEADTGFKMTTPCNIEYGAFAFISKGSGLSYPSVDGGNCQRSYFGIGNWNSVASVSVICPNQELYIYSLGQGSNDNVHGRLLVEANELSLYGSIYGCDTDIKTKNNISFGLSLYGGGSRSSLVNIDCGGEISGGWGVRACNLKLNARKLNVPVSITDSSNSSNDTSIYVNTEYAANGVFAINDPVNGNYNLFARVVELAGPFYVYNGTPPLTNDGSYIKKFKGLISFYTGSEPDTDLADFTEIAPNADFELIVLNRTKQLVAGAGITISDIGDSVVIAARNDMPLSTVEIPVVIDANDSTQCTASLVLNKYNIITGLDDVVTDMDIVVPTPTARTLREVGFEFAPVDGTQLEHVTFSDANETEFLPIAPDEYAYGCVYQGAVINRCVTLVEYGDPIEPEPQGLVIDGKTYRTVTMPDGKEWTAENIAANSLGGVWYNNDPQAHPEYGKYYTPMEIANISIPGWHVATWEDWTDLNIAVDYDLLKLRSTTGWSDGYTSTDDYGFGLLPCGMAYAYYADLSRPFFAYSTSYAYMNTTCPDDPYYSGKYAYIQAYASYLNLNTYYDDNDGCYAQPIRLVKDSE